MIEQQVAEKWSNRQQQQEPQCLPGWEPKQGL